MKLLFRIGIAVCCLHCLASIGLAQGASIARLTPGTTIDISSDAMKEAKRWNHVVLLAKPRISSGDTNKLGETIRNAVSTLSLTILATVDRADNGSFKLSEVGVGYSVPIKGTQTVVSYDTASELGARLGLIARRVLSENEKQLDNVRVVTRSSTLLVFDTPAILFRSGRHRDYTIRHLCWIDPVSGRGAMLVWILGKDTNGRLRVVDEPMQVVPAGTVEDREIHVDGQEFILGIPSERAFALESLPPGLSVSWKFAEGKGSIATLASQERYTEQELVELAATLNHAIRRAQESPKE